MQPPGHILQSCPTFDSLRGQIWPRAVGLDEALLGPVVALKGATGFALQTSLTI